MKKVHVIYKIINLMEVAYHFQKEVEEFKNKYPTANVTYLCAAGNSYGILTAIFEWVE